MSNRFDFDSNHEQFDGVLRDVVEQICRNEPPPDRVDACLEAVAATVITQAPDRSGPDSADLKQSPVNRSNHRPTRRRLMPWIAASAIVCALVAVNWDVSGSVSLADVAQAV